MIYIEEIKGKTTQKELSTIGRKLLLRGLQIEYGLSELPEISIGEFGKPCFNKYPHIHFNISHCERGVACIISTNPVGIDIESIKDFDKNLAEYVTSPKEMELILSDKDPGLAFTIIWTKKESLCKLTGKGLNTRKEIQEILVNCKAHFNTYINETGGYVLTSCYFSNL